MRIPLRLRTARTGRRLAAAALTVLAMLGSAQPARADQQVQQPQEAGGRRTLMFWIGTWDFAGQGYAAGTRPAAPAPARSRPRAVRRRPADARRQQQPRVRREHHSAPRSAPEPKAADSHR